VLGPGIIDDSRNQIEVTAAVSRNSVSKEYALALIVSNGLGSASYIRFSPRQGIILAIEIIATVPSTC